MLVSIKRIEEFLCKEDLKPDNVSTSINTGVLNILTLYNYIILPFFKFQKGDMQCNSIIFKSVDVR